MALSKHMVPLNPLVNDHFPHDMAMVGLYPIFRQTDYHIRSCLVMAHYISPRYVPMILYVHCYIITYIYTYPQIVFFKSPEINVFLDHRNRSPMIYSMIVY